MKKFLFLFVVFALILGAGCKKKVEPVVAPPPPPPPKISEVQFLLGLSGRADVKNLEVGDSLVVAINSEEILSPSASFVVVKPFDADLNYYELLAILKKLPLTVVWVGRQGSHMLIRNRLDLLDYYNSTENFLLLEPKPAYYLRAGSKEYWVGKEGKFWKTW